MSTKAVSRGRGRGGGSPIVGGGGGRGGGRVLRVGSVPVEYSAVRYTVWYTVTQYGTQLLSTLHSDSIRYTVTQYGT